VKRKLRHNPKTRQKSQGSKAGRENTLKSFQFSAGFNHGGHGEHGVENEVFAVCRKTRKAVEIFCFLLEMSLCAFFVCGEIKCFGVT
jgi:hypothetical protein